MTLKGKINNTLKGQINTNVTLKGKVKAKINKYMHEKIYKAMQN